MFLKKMERFILIFIIKHFVLTLHYVTAKPVESDIKLFRTKQFNNLALKVCETVNMLQESIDSCIENFKGFDPEKPQLSAPVKIRCLTSATARYELKPSQKWQLVILMPEDRSKITNDTDDIEFYSDIHYNVKMPGQEYGALSTFPVQNYTIWTTELEDDGTPIQWLGGHSVPQYKKAENKNYSIEVQFIRNSENDMTVNGFFYWNASGEFDMCFDVVNFCANTDVNYTKVWPKDKARIQFYNLTLNDECQIKVQGMYGNTVYKYNTPSCDYEDCSQDIEPDYASNITVYGEEDSEGTWSVQVSWATPLLQPEAYNITVITDYNYTQRVEGNLTSAVFTGVQGKGFYTVVVDATLNGVTARTSRKAFFHRSSNKYEQLHDGSEDAVVTGGMAGGAAAVCAVLYCFRRRKRIATPKLPPMDKPLKESEAEPFPVSADGWEVCVDKLALHEVIGEGAFGVVRRATLATTGQDVAVKMLKDFPSHEEVRSFRSEMELMKSVGAHPHLVSLVGCCSGRRPLIIAEYCSRGDLLSYLRCTWDIMISKRNAKYYNNNVDPSDYRNDLFRAKLDSRLVVNKLYELQDICDKELTSLDLLSFCRQIAMGMEFLAANRVVHRDLAARNILVTADRTLKIADFGLSRDVYEENQYKQKGNGKMPVKWMAIESLTRRIYTTQSDVWSFGVVAWEVATVGGAPYAGVAAARLPRLLRAGYRMPRPNNCSPQLYDIMLSCWRMHARDRPTFAELHQRLDELLNCACADHYLALELEADEPPPTPRHHRYLKLLIRGKRNWSTNYERPLKPPQSNHYSSPPAVLLQPYPPTHGTCGHD